MNHLLHNLQLRSTSVSLSSASFVVALLSSTSPEIIVDSPSSILSSHQRILTQIKETSSSDSRVVEYCRGWIKLDPDLKRKSHMEGIWCVDVTAFEIRKEES